MTVGQQTLLAERSYPASLKGRQTVEIRPQASGLLQEIRVQEGARVRKGEVLFVIEQLPYIAAKERAEAAVRLAEARLASVRLTHDAKERLHEDKVLSDYYVRQSGNSVNEAEAELAEARSALRSAEIMLANTVVKSPVSGVAGMIPWHVGSLVESGMAAPLVTVSDNSEVYAYFSLSETEAIRLLLAYGSPEKFIAGQSEVSLRLCEGSMYACEGRIDAVSGILHPQNGSLQLRAVFPNPAGLLHDGGHCEIVLRERRTDCLVIPQSVTWRLQDRTFVRKMHNGITEERSVSVEDAGDGRQYIVNDGLQAGDTVLLNRL